MSAMAMMTGARLAYVVRPIKGEVIREVAVWNNEKKRIDKKEVKKPGGFMVYFPRGHAIRLESEEDLKQYNLNQPPRVVNLEGIHDPNSPAGQLMNAQTDEARRGAFRNLEDQVIALATAKSGPVLMPEQVKRVA
jgi:hypothetical protein